MAVTPLVNDGVGLLLAGGYVVSILAVAEWLRRRRAVPVAFTRKLVHIGVGMMSWLLPFLFAGPTLFAVACVLFTAVTYIDFRRGIFASMDSKNRHNPGTVYFPAAALMVALLFWDRPPLMVAALMPLTWGDGLAPVAGRLYGTRPYTVFGHTRTVQGSIGFLAACGLFTWLALWRMPGEPAVAASAALVPAVVVAVATALTEAVTPWGLDNVTITAVAVLILVNWPW